MLVNHPESKQDLSVQKPSQKFGLAFPARCFDIMAGYLDILPESRTMMAVMGKKHVSVFMKQEDDMWAGPMWGYGASSEEAPDEYIHHTFDVKCLIHSPKQLVEGMQMLENSHSHYSIHVKTITIRVNEATVNFDALLIAIRAALDHIPSYLTCIENINIVFSGDVSFCFKFVDAAEGWTILDTVFSDWERHRLRFQKFDMCDVFEAFFMQDEKPASEVYLSTLVIPVHHPPCRSLFDRFASKAASKKLLWVFKPNFTMSLDIVNDHITTYCHVFELSEKSSFSRSKETQAIDEEEVDTPRPLNFRKNKVIQRITLTWHSIWGGIVLPESDDDDHISTLRQLCIVTEKGGMSLSSLNNTRFKKLHFLLIHAPDLTGTLDSHYVPALKTFRITCKRNDVHLDGKLNELIRVNDHWQCKISRDSRGWAFLRDTGHQKPLTHVVLNVASQDNLLEWESHFNPSNADFWGNQVEHLTMLSAYDPADRQRSPINTGLVIHLSPFSFSTLKHLSFESVSVTIRDCHIPTLLSLCMTNGRLMFDAEFAHLEEIQLKKTKLLAPSCVNTASLHTLMIEELENSQHLKMCLENERALTHLTWLPKYHNPCSSSCPPEFLNCNYQYPPLWFESFDNMAINELNLGSGFHYTKEFYVSRFYRVKRLKMIVETRFPELAMRDAWLTEELHLTLFGFLKDLQVFLPSLPTLRKLTVVQASDRSSLLLNSEMPLLETMTLPANTVYGPAFKCPSLKNVCVEGIMTAAQRAVFLDPKSYTAMGACPEKIHFAETCEWFVLDFGSEVVEVVDSPSSKPSFNLVPWSIAVLATGGILGTLYRP